MRKKTERHIPVKDLLFNKFKEAVGIKVFVLKYTNEKDVEKEKVIYNKVLLELKRRDYLTYLLNKKNIQIFLTTSGRKVIDKQDGWEKG